MMEESDVYPRNSWSRKWLLATQSVSRKLDFSAYHLPIEPSKAGEEETWDAETEIFKDKGPIFIIENSHTVYKLLDGGNFLWGNALARIGGTSEDAQNYSTTFNRNDSQPDQNAIVFDYLWWFGFKR